MNAFSPCTIGGEDRRILRLAGCEASSVGSVHTRTRIYTQHTYVHTHTYITHIYICHTRVHTPHTFAHTCAHTYRFFYKPTGENRLIISIFHPIQQTSQQRMRSSSLEVSWETGY